MKKIDEYHVSYPEIMANDKSIVADAISEIKKSFDITDSRITSSAGGVYGEIKYRKQSPGGLGPSSKVFIVSLTMESDEDSDNDMHERMLTVSKNRSGSSWSVENKTVLFRVMEILDVPKKSIKESVVVSKYLR